MISRVTQNSTKYQLRIILLGTKQFFRSNKISEKNAKTETNDVGWLSFAVKTW